MALTHILQNVAHAQWTVECYNTVLTVVMCTVDSGQWTVYCYNTVHTLIMCTVHIRQYNTQCSPFQYGCHLSCDQSSIGPNTAPALHSVHCTPYSMQAVLLVESVSVYLVATSFIVSSSQVQPVSQSASQSNFCIDQVQRAVKSQLRMIMRRSS